MLTDHLGTYDKHNARSKFSSDNSTLMKNSIGGGGGGGRGRGEGGHTDTSLILPLRYLLCYRVYFSLTGSLGHHFQRMINNLHPTK